MADYTASGSGVWDLAANWGGGGYPQNPGDNATIPTGIAITGASGAINIGAGTITIQGTGSLVWGATAMTCGLVVVGTSGAANLDTGAGLWTCTSITTASTATLTIGAGGVTLAGVLTHAGSGAGNINGNVNAGCTTFTSTQSVTVAASVTVNCTTLSVAASKTLTMGAGATIQGMTVDCVGTGTISTGAGCSLIFNSASNIGTKTLRLTMVGTSGSRCLLDNIGGGGFDIYQVAAILLNLTYVDVHHLYRFDPPDATLNASFCDFEGLSTTGSYFAYAASRVSIVDCWFSNLGKGCDFGQYYHRGSTGQLVRCVFGADRDGNSQINTNDIYFENGADVVNLYNVRLLSTTPITFTAASAGRKRIYAENYGFDGTTGTRGVWAQWSPYWNIQRSTTNPYGAETYCALVSVTSANLSAHSEYYADLPFWIPIQTGDTYSVTTHGRRNGTFPTTSPASLIVDEEQAFFTAVTTTTVLTSDATWYEFTAVSLAGAAGTAETGSVRMILRVKEYVAAGTIQWGGVTVTVTHADASTTTYVVSMQQAGMGMPIADAVDAPTWAAVGDVIEGVDRGDGEVGTYHETLEAEVLDGTGFGEDGTEYTGTVVLPNINDVEYPVAFGAGSALEGTFVRPAVGNVRDGVLFGALGVQFEGTLALPTAAQVLSAVGFGSDGTEYAGTVVLPAVGDVQQGVAFGPSSGSTGAFASPAVANVIEAVEYGAAAEYVGTYHEALVAEVRDGVLFGPSQSYEGTYGASAPSAPTLTVANVGDGDSVTATIDGDAGVTNRVYYRRQDASSWTLGGSRSGDGAVTVSGLDDGYTYYFFAQSETSGNYSPISSVVILAVSSGGLSEPIDERAFPDLYDLYRPTVTIAGTGEETAAAPATPTSTGNRCLFSPMGGTGFRIGNTGVEIDYDAEMRTPYAADLRPDAENEQPDMVEINSQMYVVLRVWNAAGREQHKIVLLRERQ